MARVLVTDGDERAALAVARSLGRAGHSVYVCAGRRRSLAGASRYARGTACVPEPLVDREGFVAALEWLVGAWRIDVLLPMTDASLLVALAARDQFRPARVPFPPVETFRRVCDKAVVLEAAGRAGIAVPLQRIITCPAEAASLPPTALPFPIVLKSAHALAGTNGRSNRRKVHYAADPDGLRRGLEAFGARAYPLLLQQRVVGPGVGVFLLMWQGRTVAEFAHRRLREKPPSGGVSVYRESVRADPALVAQSRALLEAFGWEGVAMIEYKLDAATGTLYLMEVNGRFWGSLQLAIDAGVDFPALLVTAALGGRPGPVSGYRIGVRSRWWWGDVDHLLARLLRSPRALGLAADAPGRWRALVDFLTSWGPASRTEILRFDDPRPFVRETIEWFRGAFRGLRPGR